MCYSQFVIVQILVVESTLRGCASPAATQHWALAAEENHDRFESCNSRTGSTDRRMPSAQAAIAV